MDGALSRVCDPCREFPRMLPHELLPLGQQESSRMNPPMMSDVDGVINPAPEESTCAGGGGTGRIRQKFGTIDERYEHDFEEYGVEVGLSMRQKLQRP